MRKTIAIGVVMLIASSAAFSQAYDHVMKTNPIGLAFGNINVTYEHILNEKSSLHSSINYQYSLLGVKVNSFGVEGGYRYYFTHSKKDVPSGFYIQPQAAFTAGKDETDTSYSALRFGAEVGYQFAFESGFVLDLGLGPYFTNLFGDYADTDFDVDGSFLVLPSITIAVGYAW